MRQTWYLGLSVILLVLLGCSSSEKKGEAAAQVKQEVVDVPDNNLTTSDVYDAGVYSEKEDVTDLKARGGKMFDTIPAEKFYSYDREKLVPVGKLMYVVTDERPLRCIPAKFTVLDGKKKLVVYSKSTVPLTYCIYQKTTTTDPAGFAVSISKGGICMPAVIASKVEDKKTVSVIEFFDKIISFKYCLDDTFSFGLGRGSKMRVDDSGDDVKKKKKKKTLDATEPAAALGEGDVVNP